MGIVSGETTLPVLLLPPLSKSVIYIKNFLMLIRSKFSPLEEDPILEELHCPG